MIIKLTCSTYLPDVIKLFKGKTPSCLGSKGAFNTTPISVAQHYGHTLSYWYLDDAVLTKFYGGRVSVRALTTYPGVVSVSIIETDATEYTLRDMTQYQLECLLHVLGT
jgi:hypothetical protein